MTPIEKLLVVQGHDCRIRDIQRELRDIPARKEDEKKRLAEHHAAVDAATARLKAQQVEIKKTELDIETRRERITRMRQQQMEIKTNKEFKTLESEIKTVGEQIKQVEDTELVLWESVEAIKTEIAAGEKSLKDEDAKVQADIRVLDQRVAELDAELKAEQAQRDAAAAGVEAVWMDRYSFIMTRRDRAVVKLEDGICGGCHMKLPPSAYHDTRNQQAMTACDFCGRMLYS